MVKTAWKVLKKGMVSNHGALKWKKGLWQRVEGELSLCGNGLHASENLVDAINYVTPGVICKVEYLGETIKDDDKFVAREMRVIESYRFTKRMAVEFSIFCAKLCLKNFEKRFSEDNRPRKAVEAAEAWFDKPTAKNKSAARSVARSVARSAESVARSAESVARSAESAAWSAAWSARSAESAARSAWSAAWSARSAESAWSAARSAWSAAWSARSAESAWSAARSARSAAKKKMHNKLIKIITK